MKLLLCFFAALVLIGGTMKLLGAQLPILDYPLGGPLTQPNIEVVRPEIHLP
jgi:Na+/citrate or Na+/malate symporter